MNTMKRFFHRLGHWEFWPFWAIYYPLFPIWTYLSIRAQSFFFFNAVNPTITNGGMAMESKKAIYDLVPERYLPKTLLLKASTPTGELAPIVQQAGFEMPFIVKPDIGLKGLGVEIIDSLGALKAYRQKFADDLLVQELVRFPLELGVFFVRPPGQEKGKITGIVQKEFLSITGNGHDTLGELIDAQPRSHLQRDALRKRFYGTWENVLPPGEKLVLVPFGSHTRGARFIDVSHLIDPALENRLNTICASIEGFHFGRLDILCRSVGELSRGTGFKIIEVNGAGSEPTHIYDTEHSLFFAWKEIVRHWWLLYHIASYNKKLGHPYLGFRNGREMIKNNRALEARLKLI